MKARLARTLITVSASAALVLTAPGMVGIASAHDGDGDDGQSRHSASALPAELITAVKTARDAYFTAARTAKDNYRKSVMAIRTTMINETAPQLAAAQAAKKALDDAVASGADQATVDALRATLRNAVDAFRTALTTSKTAHAAEFAAALKTATDAITAAGTVYTQAVTAAFATFAPGTTIPQGWLTPPGRGYTKSFNDSRVSSLYLDGGHH